MNEVTFKICMSFMQKLFGEIDNDVYKFYWNRFKSTPDEQFKKITSQIIDTFKPTSTEKFPSVSRFVELLGQDIETRINSSVIAVKRAVSRIGAYGSVSFGDRALHEAINSFGGWVELCRWTYDDWKFREKQFIKTYEMCLSSDDGPDHLPGLSELSYSEYEFNMPEERRLAFKDSIAVKKIEWRGYTAIENKQNKDQLKISGDIQDVVKSIGKDIPEESINNEKVPS